MNLIDFWVEEIKHEEYDKMYKLLGMTYEEAEKETWITPDDEGVKVIYRVVDMGGHSLKEMFFNLSKGQKPYDVGYKGLH